MKKSKILSFIIVAVVALFGVTGVKAATPTEVADLTSFNSCLTADGICKLTADISGFTANTELTEHDVTIDLNGHTLDLGAYSIISKTTNKLTVIDSGTTGIITSSNHNTFVVTYGGSLDVEDGTLINNAKNGNAISTLSDGAAKTYVKVGANALLKGGFGIAVNYVTGNETTGNNITIDVYGTIETFTPDAVTPKEGHIGISINGRIKARTGNVTTINIYPGASITANHGSTGNMNTDDCQAIYAGGYGIWNITGGTFTGDEAIGIKSGVFNISGGTFNGTGVDNTEIISNGNGTETSGAAISITNHNNYAKSVELNISGGTFNSTKSNALFETDTQTNAGNAVTTMSVTGGTFNGNADKTPIYSKSNRLFVSGGTYNTEPSADYIKTDLVSVLENNVYYVGTKHNINIVSATGGSISTDITSAVKGQTVTITVTPETDYVLKTIAGMDVIKVNDTTYTFTMPDEEVTLTPTFAAVVTNPNTIDSITLYIVLATISLIGISVSVLLKRHA